MLLELKDLFLTEGKRLAFSYEMDLSDVDFSGIKPFISPVEVQGTAENKAGAVRLTVDVSFQFAYPCDRCATVEVKPYRYSFTHMLVPKRNDASNEDYVEAEGYRLELDGLLRDDILLELPTKYLCRPDCKGLCPVCGKNRNDGDCDCVMHQVDPRLEVLKQLID